MSVVRNLLLAGSESRWLKEHATKYRFVRRAVRRFLPGETAADAIAACRALREQGIRALWTHLGENVLDAKQAGAVAREYEELIDAMAREGLDAQPSVKPTHLGLDVDEEECSRLIVRLASHAERQGSRLWLDMEGSAYVEPTLRLYRRARASVPAIGVCLQAYLRRTAADLEALLPTGPAIRLVKGAYREPSDVAFQRKADVDRQYLALAERLLGVESRSAGTVTCLATHDRRIISRLEALIRREGTPTAAFEFEMLYGIQRGEQRRLAKAGLPVRVLVSYGDHWFPWFMRRLAERPANVWFVVTNLFR